MKIRFPLEKTAEQCRLEIDCIIQFIELRWITPADPANQMFDEEDIARIHLIRELREIFGVNDEAVPIILHLVDQLNRRP